jgi:hypothetical protein
MKDKTKRKGKENRHNPAKVGFGSGNPVERGAPEDDPPVAVIKRNATRSLWGHPLHLAVDGDLLRH